MNCTNSEVSGGTENILVMEKHRCDWAKNPLEIEYHDTEWGVPVFDDQKLFEFMLLDAFQAGLSWSTILAKRENFRKAFDHFDYEKIASYNEDKIQELLNNQGIIRNRLKIRASVQNAIAFIKIIEKNISFSNYIWNFVHGSPIVNNYGSMKQIPANTPVSDKMSKELKKNGFTFVGSTICYAFMQAAGLVNDHLVHCFRYKEVMTA